MFEPEIFRKQMYFSEQMRRGDAAQGYCDPRYAPAGCLGLMMKILV